MSGDELTPELAAALTAAVDIEAPPPDGEPVALVLFGTNQAAPPSSPPRATTPVWPRW